MREKVDMGFIESVLGLNNAEFIGSSKITVGN